MQKRLKVLSTGAVQKCLFISDLEELDIDVPAEFNEQLKIANILKLMEDKIEVNTSINQELQSMASNIFNYTFFNSNNLFTTKNGVFEGQMVVSASLILPASIKANFAAFEGGAASIQTSV